MNFEIDETQLVQMLENIKEKGAVFQKLKSLTVGTDNNVFMSDAQGSWWGSADIATAKAKVDMTGKATFADIAITGGSIAGASLNGLAAGSLLNIQGWSFSGVFSALDADTVQWTAGAITLGDGTTFNILAGNTGNISAITYIYFDKSVSLTVLQTTTTASTSVGANKILIAVAKNESGKNATFQAFGGKGIGQLITADNIVANTITGNEIATNSIDANRIKTGELVVGTNVGLGTAQSASQVTTIIGNTVTTGYVNALNITAASVAAENITGTTLSGINVQSSAGNNKIVITTGDLIQCYNGGELTGQIYTAGSYRMRFDAIGDFMYKVGGTDRIHFNSSDFEPASDGGMNLGNSGNEWSTIWGHTYYAQENTGQTASDSFITEVLQSKSGGNVTNVQVKDRNIGVTGGIVTTWGNESAAHDAT